jgi:hypothetical protein
VRTGYDLDGLDVAARTENGADLSLCDVWWKVANEDRNTVRLATELVLGR